MTVLQKMDINYLRSRLRYDPQNGRMFWLPHASMSKKWLTRYSGKEALTRIDAEGYLTGKIDGVQLKAHRVAWAIHSGEWPNGQIDHINGIRSDNRISNLRVVTHQENHRNKAMPNTNTSGFCGVNARGNTWIATIRVKGKQIYLGTFERLEEAISAREAANILYNFTARHGKTLHG